MKKYIILIGVLILSIVLSTLIGNYINKDYSSDELKFKKEYEKINNQELVIDGYKGKYLPLNLPKNNLIKYANNDNIVSLLKEGTHVIYFGNAYCNWCRSAISVLIDAAKDHNLSEIYYYDFFSLRDAYEKGEDSLSVKLYEDIMKEIGHLIDKTFDKDSRVAGEKRLSAPTVVAVSGGEVIGLHYRTVESHTDYTSDLTIEQKEELLKIYQEMLNKMVFVCTDNC